MNENLTTVDRSEKIWAFASTGMMVHAFVQSSQDRPGFLRAMCRKSITRASGTSFWGVGGNEGWACKSCLKQAEAMWDRAEASMQPVNAYDQVNEGIVRDETPKGHPLPKLAPGSARPAFQAFPVRDSSECDDCKYLSLGRKDAKCHNHMTSTEALDEAHPVSTEADWDAVNEAVNHPAVIDALHTEALAEDAARPAVIDALTVAHREAMATLSQRSGRMAVPAPPMTVDTSYDPIASRRDREARRRRRIEADHAEALAIEERADVVYREVQRLVRQRTEDLRDALDETPGRHTALRDLISWTERH